MPRERSMTGREAERNPSGPKIIHVDGRVEWVEVTEGQALRALGASNDCRVSLGDTWDSSSVEMGRDSRIIVQGPLGTKERMSQA